MDTPYDMVRLGAVASTQDFASSNVASRPLLVVADRQTAGRGRHGRVWVTADRAVAASLAFRPGGDPAQWPRLTLLAGVAVVETVVALHPPARSMLRLKWPNDVLVGEGKLAGLLAEADHDVVTIGLGLNLFWRDPVPGAVALFDADPGPDTAVTVATAWALNLLGGRWDPEVYAGLCSTLGRDITWSEGSGRAVAVTADGALVVETYDGRVELRSGEVREVR